MFINVYLKNLRDLRNNLIYWFVGLLVLAFYLSFAYDSFSENLDSFNDLIDLSRPTNKGTIIPGKTTISLNGNVGKKTFLFIMLVYGYY